MTVHIFTPVYHRFAFVKESLTSVIRHMDNASYDCELFIGVNGYEHDEMKEWLKSICSSNIVLYESSANMGKAAIINKMYGHHNDCDYIISIDSDMVADEENNFIDDMVWSIEHFTEFGVLSTFQKCNDQQIWNGLQESQKNGPHEVRYGKYNNVAGGCVIMKKAIWDAMKGYSTYGGVYGFDDGLMMQSVHLMGLKAGVIETVKLHHPHDTDKAYFDWKMKNIAKRKSKGYYEEN